MSLIVHQHLRISIVFSFIYGIAMLFNSYNAIAAKWSITPTVIFGGEYDDNFRLTTTGDDGITGTSITPEVNFNRADPNSAVSIGARLKYTQYDNEEIPGTSVQYL